MAGQQDKGTQGARQGAKGGALDKETAASLEDSEGAWSPGVEEKGRYEREGVLGWEDVCRTGPR